MSDDRCGERVEAWFIEHNFRQLAYGLECTKGLDDQFREDYLKYRQMEFDLHRFLWERPELAGVIMEIDKIGVMCTPYVPMRDEGIPFEDLPIGTPSNEAE
jgi:hypothetical protein